MKDHGVMVTAFEIFSNNRLREEIERLGIHDYLGFDGHVAIDSGGFNMYFGSKLNYSPEELAQFYNLARPNLAIALDHPTTLRDDPATFERKIALNAENYTRMLPIVEGYDFIPVCHTPIKVFKAEYQHYVRIGRPEFIGLGGVGEIMMDTEHRKDVVDAVLFTSRRHTNRLHLFGWGAPTLSHMAELLGVESVDSSSWRKLAAFGKIVLPGSGERHVSGRESKSSHKRLSRRDKEELERCQCPVCSAGNAIGGFRKKGSAGFFNRALHNGYVLVHGRRPPKKYKVLYKYLLAQVGQGDAT